MARSVVLVLLVSTHTHNNVSAYQRAEMSAGTLEASRSPQLLPIVRRMLPLMQPQSHHMIFEVPATFACSCV